MQKQQRAKAGMKPPVKKGGALPPHLYKSGGKPAAGVPRQTVLNVLQNIKTTEELIGDRPHDRPVFRVFRVFRG